VLEDRQEVVVDDHVVADEQQRAGGIGQHPFLPGRRHRGQDHRAADEDEGGEGRQDAGHAAAHEAAERGAAQDEDLGHEPAAQHEEQLDAHGAGGSARSQRKEMPCKDQQDRQPAPAVEAVQVAVPHRCSCRWRRKMRHVLTDCLARSWTRLG
jgi:hypothetical protein